MHDKVVQEVLQGLIVGKELRLDELLRVLGQPTVAKANGLILKVEYVRLEDEVPSKAPPPRKLPEKMPTEVAKPRAKAKKAKAKKGPRLNQAEMALVVLANKKQANIKDLKIKYGKRKNWSSAFSSLTRTNHAIPTGKVGGLKTYQITRKGRDHYSERVKPKIVDPPEACNGLSIQDKALIVLANNERASINTVRAKFGWEGRWSGAFYELVKRGLAKDDGMDGKVKAYVITQQGRELHDERFLDKDEVTSPD